MSVAARRAVVRWAWRLFRREWRQQILVLTLLTVVVAAAVGMATAAYNLAPVPIEAEYGTANAFFTFNEPEPERLQAKLEAGEEWFGAIDVIGHRSVSVPGSIETVDYRTQDPQGPFGAPMLDLRDGRFPVAVDELAVTDRVAETFGLDIGTAFSLDGVDRAVVGLVENPSDLDDEFALLVPSLVASSDAVSMFVDASQERVESFRPPGDTGRIISTTGDVAEDVFAAVTTGKATVGIFGVHLKNNLIHGPAEREMQLNILKRELSAVQLVQDIEHVQTNLGIPLDAMIVAGNFNTCLEQSEFVSESTLMELRSAQFFSGYEDMPLIARITAPGRGRYPDATFDYVFVRNATFEHPPLITSARLSDHFPVTCDLAVKGKPGPALADHAADALLPDQAVGTPLEDQAAGAPLRANSNRTAWLWAIGLIALTAATLLSWKHHAGSPVMLPEAGPVMPDSEHWETRTARAEQRSEQATAVVRAGLIPHLARLMADKLVRKLLWQRSRWVETQRATAAHVAELEQRLGQLQPKLQARLDAYEKRIAELESELQESRRHSSQPQEVSHI
jgi:hypothetical protein